MKNQTAEFQLDLRTSKADSVLKGSRKRIQNHLSVAALAMLLPSFLNPTTALAGPIHVWEIQQQANSGFNTNAGYAPALATYGNTVYMAWTNPNDSTIYYSHLSGSTWTAPVQVTGIFQGAEWIAETRSAPALASFNNQLYLAWTGKNSAEIYYSNFNGSWTHQSPVMPAGNTYAVTNFAPALAPWGGELYLAWTEADNSISYSSLALSAGTWTAATKLSSVPSNSVPGASNGPALAADASGPFIAWNSDPTQSIWSSSLLGPAEKFNLPLHVLPAPPETSFSPGLTQYGNSVYMAWANGGTYSPVWVAVLAGPSLAPTPIQVQGSAWEAETSAAPAMVAGGNSIYIAWSGRTGNIWWTTLTLELINAAESDGCGLNCSRCCTPPPR